MAMWAMIASPLMIGADMRSMPPEFRAFAPSFRTQTSRGMRSLLTSVDTKTGSPLFAGEVWLNEELIRVNQDPLGTQGSRIRGNATECQVWR